MSNVNTELYITPIVNIKGLTGGIRKHSQRAGYLIKIFRGKSHSRNKKQKDMQLLDALPSDVKEQLRSYLREMDFTIAKCKAIAYFNV